MPSTAIGSEETVRGLVEDVVNEHNIDALDEYFAEGGVVRGAGQTMRGIKEFKGFLQTVDEAFPDFAFDVGDMFSTDEQVAFWCEVSGTHKGEFQGIPPTHEEFTYQSVMMCDVDGGKVSKIVYESDRVGLMKQLGVLE